MLSDPRLAVHINDGRQHLQMQPRRRLRPDHARAAADRLRRRGALYSREFYALARSRLKPGGYISQWLPAYQVPRRPTLAMIRAFIDVFPQAVLLSGAESDLMLLGATSGSRIEIDPGRLAAALARAPAVQADLERLDLGQRARDRRHVRRLGADAGRGDARRRAGDRRPSDAGIRRAIAAELRPRGARRGRRSRPHRRMVPAVLRRTADPFASVKGLDTYLALLGSPTARRRRRSRRRRRLRGTRAGVSSPAAPTSGRSFPSRRRCTTCSASHAASRGPVRRGDRGVPRALTLDPESAATHWHLGAALASRNRREEALEHLQRSVQLDPAQRPGPARSGRACWRSRAGWTKPPTTSSARSRSTRSRTTPAGTSRRCAQQQARRANRDLIASTLTTSANAHTITRLSAYHRPARRGCVRLPFSCPEGCPHGDRVRRSRNHDQDSRPIRSADSGPPGAAGRSTAWTRSSTPWCSCRR